ncbi:MliC family protein [Halomonas binhaiensis]|uniref:MliC family protein n=1 Tax=Halomonas binhaiensis TaxID=2562282 RepID=A0A5C1NES4_9GAMM|nr:MliC family protein [Halomonas binhaiensis]QEM82212.1 MliC family protein [Halomonas binhaiensis]
MKIAWLAATALTITLAGCAGGQSDARQETKSAAKPQTTLAQTNTFNARTAIYTCDSGSVFTMEFTAPETATMHLNGHGQSIELAPQNGASGMAMDYVSADGRYQFNGKGMTAIVTMPKMAPARCFTSNY